LPAENHTVKPSFIIHTAEGIAGKHLFIFPAKQGIAFIALQNDEHIFTDVLVYHTENGLLENDLQRILTDSFFLRESFSNVDIVWSVAESIIVPQAFFSRDKYSAMLDLVYGSAGNWHVKSELLLSQNMYNTYRVEATTENIILQKFPAAIQSHQATAMVNFNPAEKELLYCNFYPGSLTVLLRKNNQLQLVQNFNYATPEDAAYHLLNVCQRFEVNAIETVITASGTIDENSNLYRELYKYFSAINFCKLPEGFLYADDINELPQQYFCHFITAATCVL
jgi:hypothetical protein